MPRKIKRTKVKRAKGINGEPAWRFADDDLPEGHTPVVREVPKS